MPSNILMPALSPTMEKGNLAKWLKQVGDEVKAGDVIAEIETDKATMEVEAVDEGVLAKIVVPEGTQDVPVNELIGVIAADGEDVNEAASSGGGGAPQAEAKAPESAAAEAPREITKAPEPAKMDAPKAKQANAEPAPPSESRDPAASPSGGGATPAAKPAAGSLNGASGQRLFASPLARRLAKEADLDLAQISGSGPHGRVVQRDIEATIAGGGAKAPPEAARPEPQPAAAKPAAAPPAAPAVGMSDDMVKKFFEAGTYDEIPHDSMRKTIARRLQEAKQTIPHFYLSCDIEIDALLALREQVNATAPVVDGKPAFKISVNDFVIKALAISLIRVPDANVTWTEAALLKHRSADVGVAVAIPGGLITPVVRQAQTKTLSVISNEMKDFAARAKNRKLKPTEYQGGSTAVSNLGMFGIPSFQAVINPPHATILAVGAGEKRVVVREGAPAVATLMTVNLSTDHRAVDGALGAQLLQAFKQLIESPMSMLV